MQMQKVSSTKKSERAPLDVFIPEAYLTHKEILVELNGEYGLIIPASELGNAIKSSRIAAEVVSNRKYTVIY